MKIALTRQFPGGYDAKLNAHYGDVVVLDVGRPLSKAELKSAVKGIDVLVCTVCDRIDSEILASADKLKCLITYSVGVDHVDLAGLRARQIPLVHTPSILTDATADLTLALLLGCARRLKPAMHALEEGRFPECEPGVFLGLSLGGATLGIVGLGRIGTAVARRAAGFGMRIVFASSGAARADKHDWRCLALEELLRVSDIVSLHCPLSARTRHLIGRRELSIMKPAAVLINTARGPVVDEKALLAHLRTHPQFFAGLDVFEEEPAITPGLRQLPNALCLPHIGSATAEARNKMARICMEEAIRFAKDERLGYEYPNPG